MVISAVASVCSDADDSEEENLESDLGQVGTHAFARMEGDVDKQRKQILQGQMSEAAVQKQHQRKYPLLITSPQHSCTGSSETLLSTFSPPVILSHSYSRWLFRARAEDLSDIAALKALYQTGVCVCLCVCGPSCVSSVRR